MVKHIVLFKLKNSDYKLWMMLKQDMLLSPDC